MFTPSAFEIKELAQCQRFIETYSFGLLLSSDLSASHVPFLLDRQQGGQGVLYCHLARANGQWRELVDKQVLVVFSGPHAYISPTWYERGPAVPTWNYGAVHVRGKVELLDETKILELVYQTVDAYEPGLPMSEGAWSQEYNRKLVKGIVGLKISDLDWQGKLKLGQNRSVQDLAGIREGLAQRGREDDIGLLKLMDGFL